MLIISNALTVELLKQDNGEKESFSTLRYV